MKRLFLIAMMSNVLGAAYAEDLTCTVKGMHCTGCKEMVEGKLCDEAKYPTCEVKILDANKELGQVHLITKDNTAKVDQKSVSAIIEDAGYKLQKCSPTMTKGKTKS